MNNFRNRTACFTGHRNIPQILHESLKKRLEEKIKEIIGLGYCYFGVGGALGFDTLAAETILSLKSEYPFIKLILVLPCKNQTAKWKKEEVLVYDHILSKCDKVVYIAEEYTQGCMMRRNRHLVNFSSVCICYLTKNSGGTAYTVRYALENGLKIINIS